VALSAIFTRDYYDSISHRLQQPHLSPDASLQGICLDSGVHVRVFSEQRSFTRFGIFQARRPNNCKADVRSDVQQCLADRPRCNTTCSRNSLVHLGHFPDVFGIANRLARSVRGWVGMKSEPRTIQSRPGDEPDCREFSEESIACRGPTHGRRSGTRNE